MGWLRNDVFDIYCPFPNDVITDSILIHYNDFNRPFTINVKLKVIASPHWWFSSWLMRLGLLLFLTNPYDAKWILLPKSVSASWQLSSKRTHNDAWALLAIVIFVIGWFDLRLRLLLDSLLIGLELELLLFRLLFEPDHLKLRVDHIQVEIGLLDFVVNGTSLFGLECLSLS